MLETLKTTRPNPLANLAQDVCPYFPQVILLTIHVPKQNSINLPLALAPLRSFGHG